MKRFNINEIKPKGWLLNQLKIQADGLGGNLDKVWNDVKNSAWIGGNAEDWERVPYWLDGFIPLAYLLDDNDMKTRAKKYIDAIISKQQEDGWICPCSKEQRKDYDLWALFLLLKVLVLYFECTEDDRIPKVVEKALYNLYIELKNHELKLKDWGKYRWFEALISINFIYEKTSSEWLVSLSKLLKKQGADYSLLKRKWKKPKNKWSFDTHVVNAVMALKEEAISKFFKPSANAEELYSILEKYNGTAVGSFTGDECLSGISPIQGTELCSITELMYSFEILCSYTENMKWADRLDKLTFNALPAAFTKDMWAHQYDQMVNQIDCTKFKEKSIFRTNGKEAHLFGLEPHFGCCTANMNQGWPKYAMNTFMKKDNSVISLLLVPCELNTKINNVQTNITLNTDYPFGDVLNYVIKCDRENEFDFVVRIPCEVDEITVNGQKMQYENCIHINKIWKKEEQIQIKLNRKIKLSKRQNDLNVLSYGPLVFSLPIKGEWKMIEYIRDNTERKFPYCDYEIKRKSDWNYAFCSTEFKLLKNEHSASYFSESKPSLLIEAQMVKINWGYKKGFENVCNAVPKSKKILSEKEKIYLQPYGSTILRMTEMPFINEEEDL